jgi:hypothetical protein
VVLVVLEQQSKRERNGEAVEHERDHVAARREVDARSLLQRAVDEDLAAAIAEIPVDHQRK